MLPTASELDAVANPRKWSEKGKRGRGKSTVDSPTVDEEGKAYSLARGVVKGPTRVNWKQVDFLDNVGFGKYFDTECFVTLPVECCDFRINTKGLIRLTAHGVFNQRECSWGCYGD